MPSRGACRACLLARRRAAGRTCTTSREYEPLDASSAVRRGQLERAAARSRAPSRAARSTPTRRSSPGKSRRRRGRPSCPFPITAEALDRGQERYNIYCAPCHDQTGERRRHDRAARLPPAAVVPHRAAAQAPPGYYLRRHHQRLRRDARLRAQIAPRDRWAIVAYVRALQLRQPTAAEAPIGAPGATSRRRRRRRRPQPAAGALRRRCDSQTITRTVRPIDVPALDAAPAARADRRRDRPRGRRARRAGCNPTQFFQSWLIGFLFCLGLSLGCAGAADAAAPDRRPVGPGRPAHLRGGEPHAAARGAALRPDRSSRCRRSFSGRARKRSPATRSSRPRRRT